MSGSGGCGELVRATATPKSVAGERYPHQLATLRYPRCHKSEAAIAEQLTGHWRDDHFFALGQGLKMYDALTDTLTAYDREILRQLDAMARADRPDDPPPPVNRAKVKGIKAHGEDPLRRALYRMSGVDLTTIDALVVAIVSVVLSEYGADLILFPTEQQFVSRVGLAPHQPISGGKVLKRKRKPGSASACVGAALRMATLTMRHSQTALGGYYRQIARRVGATSRCLPPPASLLNPFIASCDGDSLRATCHSKERLQEGQEIRRNPSRIFLKSFWKESHLKKTKTLLISWPSCYKSSWQRAPRLVISPPPS